MKITIQGQDYTEAFDGERPLTIERKLNEPSICSLWLSLPTNGIPSAPLRDQYLEIIGDDETTYFTGYIAASPVTEYAGVAIGGAVYRTGIQAFSDELLLDRVLMAPSAGASGAGAGALMTSLVTHTGASGISTLGVSLSSPVSNFAPEPGASWSDCAGIVANQARAAYRAVSGALTLSAVPGAVHSLNEADGSLELAGLAFASAVKRGLANDVTVCGEPEPGAYVTEYFLGDGVTTQFYLGAAPFFGATTKSKIISELFNESAIDQRVWNSPGGNGYVSLGAGGLVMNGGNGIDGETLLSWLDPVEMGGTLLLEATGITMSAGSTGILAGFFIGLETQSACIAGFLATTQQGTGAVGLQPLIGGTAAGTSYAVNPANQYALRVRVHCADEERILSMYRSFGDSGAITAGGQSSISQGKLQLEIQEFVNGVGGMPVTLYDGAIANLPAACTVVAASSMDLAGTMRAMNLTRLGSGWVVSTPAGGGAYTRRMGTLAEAGECHVTESGKVEFYAGSIPAVGEQISVSYRTVGRAVGRAVNAASQQALTQAGSPAVAAWIGTVISPAARSSADCRNAALVIEQAAAGVCALWSGSYRANRMSFASDVWPGDALLLNAPSANLNTQMVVRAVKVSYQASYPDLVTYAIEFANDWADDLAIKTSTTVPSDAWLPAAIAPTYLSNLTGLTATVPSGNTVTVNTGVNPPTGGGFEIRRRDFTFMPGEDTDLVVRATLPNITLSRQSTNDRFFIRMYDGSTPPNYSEFSTALFINLPLGC